MRGYGDSEKPAGIHSYFLLTLVEDLRQLVAGLGKHKFHLVAHDWGGFVCWTFATMVNGIKDQLVHLKIVRFNI